VRLHQCSETAVILGSTWIKLSRFLFPLKASGRQQLNLDANSSISTEFTSFTFPVALWRFAFLWERFIFYEEQLLNYPIDIEINK